MDSVQHPERLLVVAPAYESDHPRLVQKIGLGLHSRGWAVSMLGFRGMETPDGIRLTECPKRSGYRRFGAARQIARAVGHEKPTHLLVAGVEAWLVVVALMAFRRSRPVIMFDAMEDYVGRADYLAHGRLGRCVLRMLLRLLFAVLSARTDLVILSRSALSPHFPGSDKVTFYNFYRSEAGLASPRARDAGEPLKLIHTGVLCEERGTYVLADVLERCAAAAMRIDLTLIGRFSDESGPPFRERVSRLQPWVRLHEVEWCSLAECARVLRMSHLGLVLFQPVNDNLRNSMPNKAFDCMANGLPVIAPVWSTELASLLRGTGGAFLVDTASSAEVFGVIDGLYADERRRYDAARNAYTSSQEELSLDHSVDQLLTAIGLLSRPTE